MNSTFIRLLSVLAVLVSGLVFWAPASAATLSASPVNAAGGGSVTAAWSGIVGPTATDWIGLYVPGSADTDYLRRQNTNGAASGSAAFALPATLIAGTYELRLFANNTYTLLATSNTFTVTTLSANPPAATQGGSTTVTWTNIISPTVRDWIALATPASPNGTYLSRRYTTGTASGSTTFDIPAAAALQTYELRLFANNTTTRLATTTIVIKGPFSFSASPATVAPGASATATWANILAPTATDWVGLYAQGAADAHYQARAYTAGASSGSLNLPVPADTGSGSYELRLFSNDTFTRLAVSNSFTVTGAAPSISASPSSAVPGDTLTATWGGIYSPTPNDWVALYQPGLADTEPLRLQLTGAVAASGSAPFDIPAGIGPGTYELRLLSPDGLSLLATSGPITVTTVTTAPFAYIHPDHLDTPRLIENQAQQIVWRWDNDDPFGGNAPDEDPSGLGTFTCNLRLPGQYFDQETNNHYNSFRDYSPETGRYIQSDPIGLAGGLNTYLYVHNEPVRLFDEMGLEVRVCYFPQAANGLGHVGIGIVGSPSTYGFYPNAEAGISQLIKGTPGLVAEDPRNPNALTGATCRVLSSTANQDSCIEKCIKSRASNPGTYKLLTRQCTSFARDCLTECMLPAGDPNTPRPGKWYDSLPNGPQSSYIPTPATPIENAPLF